MKHLLVVLVMTITFCFSYPCIISRPQISCAEPTHDFFWGSYTDEITYSFDHRFYAIQSVENHMIKVSIYLASSDKLVDSFIPARSMDFWGICWERDTYNIWIQSADIGILCYAWQGGGWEQVLNAEPPTYIISRWDESYRNSPELWGDIYVSPQRDE